MKYASYMPADLVAALPGILGYEPSESLVAVGIDLDGIVLGCVRFDWRACAGDAQVAHDVGARMDVMGATAVLLVSYTNREVRLSCPAIDAVAAALGPCIATVMPFVVQGGRYFVPGCFDACCPPQGNLVGADPDLNDFERGEGGSCDAIEADIAAERWRRRWRGTVADRQLARRMWDRALVRKSTMTPRTAGRLAAALDDLWVRDYVVLRLVEASDIACEAVLAGRDDPYVAAAMAQILQGSGQGTAPRSARATCILRETADLVGGRDRAHVTTLLAVLAWWQGDCARTSMYCAKALRTDPQYRLAQLLQLAADRRIGPIGRRIPDKST